MSVTIKDFYADWCGPCETQDPILEEISEEWGDQCDIEKIDVDEQQDVANEYHVRSLPTLVIEQDGEIVDRFVGVTPRDDIEDSLQDAGLQ
ncbi:thioredoxin [Salinarchaeum sp. IM2453]|uniref:thioredoxin n=1 Tax=Salinarchaeum sp. IM2453 TaxID=2862870 RepID=UPI001C828D0A|nr:thioredoxin [Salinarchaeum sp. IM2453]QZA89603.1 thioredoxin [Salinarchaeum sp. IM2453]